MEVEGEPLSSSPAPPSGPRPEVDSLQLGPAPETPRRRRLVRGLAVVSVAAVAVAAFAVDAQRRGAAERDVAGQAPSVPAPVPTPAPSAPPPSTTTPPAVLRPSTEPNLAIAGAGSSVLFARSDSTLFRIALSSGRVTPTAVVSVNQGGVATMIVGPRQVIIADDESGDEIVVPDGRPARALPTSPRSRRQLIAGPDGLLWARTLEDSGTGPLVLVDSDDRIRGDPVALGGAWPQSDGRGGVVLSDVGGVYELRGSTILRLTGGSLSAIGLNHYLFVTCDRHHRCGSYLYDRATKRSRRLGPADTSSLPSGTISADGRYAALIRWQGSAPPSLDVTDLRRGTSRVFPGQFNARYGGDAATSLAWTPDSRWLIALLDGQIKIFDTRTGRIRSSSPRLPTLVQLAMRTP